MWVVVNVDDLGLHPAVQRAVEIGAKQNIVTSASIVANGHYVKEVCQISLLDIGLGVHLNILRGKPLSDVSQVSSLVRSDGYFWGSYGKLFERYLRGKIRISDIEAEWKKQIEYVLESGIQPTHIDSEKHIHCWPALMTLACQLAKRYQIKWVRRPIEKISVFRLDRGGWRVKLLSFWSLYHKKIPGICWSDAVWGIADQAERFTSEGFRSYIRFFKQKAVIECVCHPGKLLSTDPPLPREFGKMRVECMWEPEFLSLTEGGWQELFQEKNLTLANYGQLDGTCLHDG